jgi:hypothetical protein
MASFFRTFAMVAVIACGFALQAETDGSENIHSCCQATVRPDLGIAARVSRTMNPPSAVEAKSAAASWLPDSRNISAQNTLVPHLSGVSAPILRI